MAPHSSTRSWKIPWMEEPGGLQSMGSLSQTGGLSNFTFTFLFHALKKEMAIHSSILAWRIPGTGEPAIHGVAQSRTRLKRLSSSSSSVYMENAMATLSSILAWRISGTEEPGGLLSMGSHRVGHN